MDSKITEVEMVLVHQNMQLDRQSRGLKAVVGQLVVVMGMMDSKITEVEMDVEMFKEDQEVLEMELHEVNDEGILDFEEDYAYEKEEGTMVDETGELEETVEEDDETNLTNIELKPIFTAETLQEVEDYEKYVSRNEVWEEENKAGIEEEDKSEGL